MTLGLFSTPVPVNEPVKEYRPGSPERVELKAKLAELGSDTLEIPLIIGGREVRTGRTVDVRAPHDHQKLLARCHTAGPEEVRMAIRAAMEARHEWLAMPWEARSSIFLKAAELLAGPYRQVLNAATMLGQSKNAYQAEIDSACELIDFLRFNVHYLEKIYRDQPRAGAGTWNRIEYRPLEGFVFAVTPFNFTAIAGNLPTSPAMMGNVVLWKPATSAVFSAWWITRILKEAGLPGGVINFLPGPGAAVGTPVFEDANLAGVHFTGSTATFQGFWKTVGENISRYRAYPRMVGETGGKDFIVAHPSADSRALATAIVRGGYEYQGQKCSAASRCYIPDSRWPEVQGLVLGMLEEIRMGDVEDFTCFMNAVIDRNAFASIRDAIEFARSAPEATILAGGGCDESKGWFIEPTLIQAARPDFRTMVEEIFGPVVTVFVYPEKDYREVLALCDRTSPYALTGSIFARDRAAIVEASRVLLNAAGNFYINDKPTGAVVSQQPFGGARGSGTNDKAGSHLNLLRWASPRVTKETFVPPTDYRYPFMQAD